MSKVAARILSLPASSAAVERSFSTYSNIHTKKRNRLTNEHASKIVFIAHNLKLLEIEDEHPVCTSHTPLLSPSTFSAVANTSSTDFSFPSLEEYEDVEEDEYVSDEDDEEEQEDEEE